METFKPTDDQLFDFHLNQVDKNLRVQIEAYLKVHPEETEKLLDFGRIELGFKENFELEAPSELALQRVRKMARSQLKPKFFDVVGFFKITPMRKQLAWAAVICLVVGLSFVLKDARHPLPIASRMDNNQQKDVSAASAATMAPETVDTLAKASSTAPQDQDNRVFDDYTKAVGLYNQKSFAEACDLFKQIMITNPTFEKRVELYTLWIEALKNLGDTEQAKQKAEELKQIVERQNSVGQ